ncbi:MAG: glycine cleavage system protein GcvH [bacterium]|jgi:glycine cleavage system H protein
MSKIPEGLKYSKEHEWVRVDGGKAYVGITDYAQDQLGDVVFVELPEVGEEFKANERFGVIESVKAVADVYLPVTGAVVEINEALLDSPELLNDDPYGEGWMVVVSVADEGELEDLFTAGEYGKFLQEEP